MVVYSTWQITFEFESVWTCQEYQFQAMEQIPTTGLVWRAKNEDARTKLTNSMMSFEKLYGKCCHYSCWYSRVKHNKLSDYSTFGCSWTWGTCTEAGLWAEVDSLASSLRPSEFRNSGADGQTDYCIKLNYYLLHWHKFRHATCTVCVQLFFVHIRNYFAHHTNYRQQNKGITWFLVTPWIKASYVS